MNIRGKQVTLRAIEEADLPLIHEWGNDPELWTMLGGWHFPTSLTQTKRWFERLQDDPANQRFAVDAPEGGMIGLSNLVDIDWKNNHALHGMLIGRRASRGQGLGVDAIMAVMRHAFDELHFARLDGAMIEYNAASLHVYCDKCGWQIEGRLRDWFFRRGRYWDKIVVGITRDVYYELAARTRYWETQSSSANTDSGV